jgi:hypothetical protein
MADLVSASRILTTALGALTKAMPAVYVFGGAPLGGWIARYNQHRQWVWDNRAREYRELVDGLFRSTEEILKARRDAEAPITDPLADAVWNGTRLTQNRIFIAQAIRSAGIDEDWQEISNISLWNPGEFKITVKGKEWGYTQGAVVILRRDLEAKLLALAQRDLKL